MMRSLALVPLRGGSKSIPRKNVKLIAGKPLCYWSLKAACDSKCFDAVYVSTEDTQIKEIVNQWLPEVCIHTRPAHLAEDTTSTEAVIFDFIKNHDCDILATVQATSPMVQPEDFSSAMNKFLEQDLDSLFTGVLFKRFLWDYESNPINYDPRSRPRRQDFLGSIMENGAFYLTKRHILESFENRLGGRIGYHLMDAASAVEIDETEDWGVVESLLLRSLSKK